jgi:thiol-disulfide isomerase/thioredoxin
MTLGLFYLWLAASPLLPVGTPAPAVRGFTQSGRTWTEDLAGQVTVVDFFAVWCPHCRDSLTDYAQLSARYGDKVRLLIIDVGDSPALVQRFFAKNRLPPTAALVLDADSRVARGWGVHSFPSVFVVDKAGIIREAFSGWGAGSAAHLFRWLDYLLDGRTKRRPVQAKRRRPGEKEAAPTSSDWDERARRLGVEVLR